LFAKEFSVSTAPEVGRIIDFQNLPSTLNFAFLSISYDWLKNHQSSNTRPLYRRHAPR
jgi:hypothetical protein